MTDRAGVIVAGGRLVRTGGREKAVVDLAGSRWCAEWPTA